MAKRIGAWLLCMAMLLSLTPVVALDATAVSSTMPGASEFCDHTDHSGWQAWDKTGALPTAAGNYYLTEDVKISVAWEVTADIHLCLNGHSITQTGAAQRVGNVRGGAELSIYDCTGKETAKITGGSGTSGAAFNINRLGKLNLYGGTITGNGNSASGGAIYLSAANDSVKTGGMFNMYGGTITGNSCLNGNVYVAGGKSGYTNTVFNMYGGTITGNSASGNGGAILAKAYGIVNITDGVITGNTTAAGSAVSVTDNAKLTVSGDTVIANNTNAAGAADVVLTDKLYVSDLTGGSNITIQTTADQTDAANVIAVGGKQTASWQAGWVTYRKLDGSETDIGYITSGSGKAFAFGHYHGDQKYTAYDGGANHNLMKTSAGYYYLTADILRSATSAGHLSLDSNAEQHLCLNGHTYTHRNPAIRLYYLNAGDKLYIEDCTSYYDEKDEFVAGGIYYGGASDSTVADGSFAQVKAGAQLTLENIKVSGFHSTKSPALRVLGEATNRGVLNMTGVELTDNTNAGTAGVIYANTGATVNMTDCVITGNTAKTVSVLNTGGDAQVTITDCIIIGNTTSDFGTINVANGNTVIKLVGATQVIGNTGGNLHLQKESSNPYKYNLDGLTEGAKVGVTLHEDRIDAGQLHFSSVVAEGKNPLPYCVSDDDTYKVALDEQGRLALVLKNTEPEPEPEPEPEVKHEHCLEGHGTCTDHDLVGFTAWDDATKLPETSGKYYLTTDVTVTNRAGLNNVDVTLCLNGHSIQADASYTKSRAFYLRGAAKLTLTDCAEEPGKITGFQASAIMCDGTCTDAQISLYNIEVSGNSNTGAGGAIVLQGVSEFNLYSGKLSGNTASGNGGAVYAAGTATVNLLGGQISGNTAKSGGGAIIGDSAKTIINLDGTKISGNTAANGGGILLQNRAHLEMTSGEASGNTATTNAGGVYISTNSSMNMTGGKVTGNISNNYTAGISAQTGAKLTLSGNAQVTDNAAAGSFGGVYVHNKNGGVSISGNVQISGNTAKDQPSNLYLAGTSVFTAGKLGEKGNVGIGSGATFRAVSKETAEDVSAGYYSDNKSLGISYQDNVLFLGAPDGHSHCFCAGENNHCNHAQVKFAPWESTTSLPTSGNWYLTGDVVLKNRAGLENVTLNLCLNGYTIRVHEDYTKGRAFYFRGNAKLTLTDCNETPGIITGATASAIAFDGTCDGAELNLYNITFTGNSATMGGGAVMVQGKSTVNMYSGAMTDNVSYTILKVDAEGNPVLDANGNQQAAYSVGGGAIATHSTATTLNIYGGKLIGNRANRLEYLKAGNVKAYAGGSGGAIYAKGNLTIHEGVEISGNVAEANGGGILVGGNDTTITIHGGKITGNTGKAGGGLLCQNRTNVFMNGGEIDRNNGTTAGGVYVSINSQFTMNGGTISGNNSSGDAGGMYVYASIVTLNAGSIKNNKATGNGGGICSNKGTATVNGEKVDKGVVITIGKDFSVTGNYSAKNAGGIMLNGKTGQMTLDGGSISNNTAKAAAGGVLTQNSSIFYLKSGKISGNKANTGGGIYVSTNTTLKMTGGSITGNSTVKSHGAGLYMLRSTGYFSGGSISYNTSGAAGGGIYMGGATAYLQGTYLGNNTATTNGGGLGCGQTSSTKNGVTTKYQCKIVLSGSTIANNVAKNGGGFIIQSYTVFDITSGEIRDNEATTNGGGIYASTNSTVNMTGGSLHGNYAQTSGSAVYHYRSSGNYTDVKFYNNRAEKYYGTIFVSQKYVGANSVLSFTNCKFYNNQVGKDGGAFYGGQNCLATMTECMFTENTAGEDGGAILCRGNVTMTNCLVTDNTAGANGGGIATDKCGIRGSKPQEGLVLIDTTVSNNTAGAQGGGLYLSTGCITTMTDVEITGNTAAAEGGGYWAVDDTTLHNVTVTGNTSGGEGYAAWYDYSVFDGHSYFVGVHKITGDMIIKDNEGGDVYLGQEVAMSVGYEGLGEKTHMEITLDSGVLTNRLYGEYDYEGENLVYTVTYGSRSFTDPETDETLVPEETQPTDQTQEAKNSDIWLYVGIGVLVLILIVVALILMKKKKAGKSAEEASKN